MQRENKKRKAFVLKQTHCLKCFFPPLPKHVKLWKFGKFIQTERHHMMKLEGKTPKTKQKTKQRLKVYLSIKQRSPVLHLE